MRPNILIIDDDPAFISKLRFAFKNYLFKKALSWQSATSILKNNFDLILLDLKLNPDSDELNGLEYIKYLKDAHPDTPLVVVTADEATDTVVKAMKEGADDFLRKSEYDLLTWQKKFELLIENKRLAKQVKNYEQEQFIFIGESPEILEIKNTLRILAENPDITVLITGETGVGKEVAARYLHQQSLRKNGPFVAVNLSSIQENLIESALFGHKKGAFTGANYEREGYFRKANEGILFLDEIGDISPEIQIKLLRFLDTKKIQIVGDEKDVQLDVQIIAATNQDLANLVKEGKFRSDLYFRLKNFQIEIPPLRTRCSDISLLLDYYLSKAGISLNEDNIEKNVIQNLLNYHWPGNVRELKNVVDSILLKMRILKKVKIDLDCLPEELKNYSSLNEKELSDVQTEQNDLLKQQAVTELTAIERSLAKTFGQKQAAGELLSMSADQLRYRVLKWWKFFPKIIDKFPNIKRYYKLKD